MYVHADSAMAQTLGLGSRGKTWFYARSSAFNEILSSKISILYATRSFTAVPGAKCRALPPQTHATETGIGCEQKEGT